MRRAADLYPGEAKTDRRDAFVIADTARMRRRQVHWLDTGSDELLEQLRVLNASSVACCRRRVALTDGSHPSVRPSLMSAVTSLLKRLRRPKDDNAK